MSGDAGPIRFHFDFISPNAYLAWDAIHGLAARRGRDVLPVPVLFAALLDASDRPGPAEVAPMRRWMMRNCARKARDRGIPFRPPASHPFRSLLALRMATVALASDPEAARRLIDALFRAVWGASVDVVDPAQAAEVADRAGCDGAALVAAAGRPGIKEALRAATAHAVDEGVFGVPTAIVDGELFWGFDDLPWLDRFLADDDPIAGLDLSGWNRVRPSATRPARRGKSP